MKVTDGNGTTFFAKLRPREWAGIAAIIAIVFSVLRWLELDPEAVRGREGRFARIERALEEQARLNRENAEMLRSHLVAAGEGFERISALEEHDREEQRMLDRELDRMQDRLRRAGIR